MLKIFDLFSGCGGFRLAFENAGFNCTGFCEQDKHAVKLYKAFFNTENEVYFNDVRTILPEELPQFDILTAGFPCQSFSIAGKKLGLNDTRGSLLFEVLRILQKTKPKCVVLENVKGLFSTDNGKVFCFIVKTLAELGYHVEWGLFNTKYFGLPQNRERVFIIGLLGEKNGGKILPLSINAKNNNSENSETSLIYWKNSRSQWVEEKRRCINALKTQTDLCRQQLIKAGTLRTYNDGKGFRAVTDDKCPTIPARAREDGSGQAIILECSLRRLTPLECFRLQGFPDDIVKTAYELGISDAQLYKMAGNTVSIPVVQSIAEKIYKTWSY